MPVALRVIVCETELFAPPIWKSNDSEELLTVIVGSAATVSVTAIEIGVPEAGVMLTVALSVPAASELAAEITDTATAPGTLPLGVTVNQVAEAEAIYVVALPVKLIVCVAGNVPPS